MLHQLIYHPQVMPNEANKYFVVHIMQLELFLLPVALILLLGYGVLLISPTPITQSNQYMSWIYYLAMSMMLIMYSSVVALWRQKLGLLTLGKKKIH
jgi:hypothetical protein